VQNDLSQIDDVHLQVIIFQVVQWRTHTTRPFFALNDNLHFDLIKPQMQYFGIDVGSMLQIL
jgi:hypothetical protein